MHLNLTLTLSARYLDYPHFTDEKNGDTNGLSIMVEPAPAAKWQDQELTE